MTASSSYYQFLLIKGALDCRIAAAIWPSDQDRRSVFLTWNFAGRQWASHQAQKSQDKTPGVFFYAALDFDAPGSEIPLKSVKITKNRIYLKNRISKNNENQFEVMSLYSFSRRIRIWSPNRPKPVPKPDLEEFSKKSDFWAPPSHAEVGGF